MRQISGPLHVARHVLMSDRAWLLFVEIPTSGGGAFRLVRDAVHRRANGVTWQRAALEIDPPAEDMEGSLGQLSISIPNVSRIPLAYVELDVGTTGVGEVLGKTITVWLQHETRLEVFEPALSWKHRALAVSADEATLRIECGHPAAAQRVPGKVFTRAEFPQLLAQGA